MVEAAVLVAQARAGRRVKWAPPKVVKITLPVQRTLGHQRVPPVVAAADVEVALLGNSRDTVGILVRDGPSVCGPSVTSWLVFECVCARVGFFCHG